MIQDLDLTLRELLETRAPPGSELALADIVFDLPDGAWRTGLGQLTLNCYLHDIRENRELKTTESLMHRSADRVRALRRRPPVRLDCSFCISAWSTATDEPELEEHRLLSQVVRVLLRHPTIPPEVLQGSLAGQIAPYPTVIAAPDGIHSPPEFWGALDQQLRPSLNYVVTLAMLLDDEPSDEEMIPVIQEIEVVERHMDEAG